MWPAYDEAGACWPDGSGPDTIRSGGIPVGNAVSWRTSSRSAGLSSGVAQRRHSEAVCLFSAPHLGHVFMIGSTNTQVPDIFPKGRLSIYRLMHAWREPRGRRVPWQPPNSYVVAHLVASALDSSIANDLLKFSFDRLPHPSVFRSVLP